MKLSVLDLCPILAGENASQSLRHAVHLAQFCEEIGYERYWIAEHHSMEGIGSSAPEVLISHIASETKKMRIGAGGIMLPNHSSYHIAEVFRTLEALYPGRIDLGLGRAQGTGAKAAAALRRTANISADEFPQQVDDLIRYFKDEMPEKAFPAASSIPELWILGSSGFGAKFAAIKGLPYSFAQHFSHLSAIEVIGMYKKLFQPSPFLNSPMASMGCHIIVADSDEEAETIALSSDVSLLSFYQGKNIPLPSLEEAIKAGLTAHDREQLRITMPKFVGSKSTVLQKLRPFLHAGIDHLVVLSMIHDQEARRHSYKLLHEIFAEIK